jgi:large subunit ribosomal protein L30
MEGQKRTVRALGFTKLHQSREVEATPQMMGMINKVAHLLKIEKI